MADDSAPMGGNMHGGSDTAPADESGGMHGGDGTQPFGTTDAPKDDFDSILDDVVPKEEEPGTDEPQLDLTEPEKTEKTGTESAEAKEDTPDAEIEPPAHWSAEDQARFRETTPEWQKWLTDRSNDMDAAHTRRSQEVAPYRQLTEKWGPYAEQLQANLPQVVDGLLDTEHTLRTGTMAQKRAVALDILNNYGITFDDQGEGEGDGGEINPQVAQLSAKIDEMGQYLQGQGQVAQQQQHDHLLNQVQAFAAETNGEGQPAHPYLEQVYQQMIQLAAGDRATGQQSNLNSLYDRAIRLNDEVFSKVQASEAHSTEAKRQRDEAEKVKKAKGASVQVSGAGAVTKDMPPDDIDAILEEMVPKAGWG